jgi:hypothetical protein
MEKTIMQSHSDLQQHDGAFIEENATIEIDGHSYTSSGAFLAKRTDTGKYCGILYASGVDHKQWYQHAHVGSWDGSIKIPAYYGNAWKNNFGDARQSVYFTHAIDGVKRYFYGVYYRSSSDIVRVQEVKSWDKPQKPHDYKVYFYDESGAIVKVTYRNHVKLDTLRTEALAHMQYHGYADYAFSEL